MTQNIIAQLSHMCEQNLDLNTPLSEEYFYAHLVCCVLDAVYSIGARYTSTRQVPIRYCQAFGLQRLRPKGTEPQPEQAQQKLSVFVHRFETMGLEAMLSQVLQNRQRTSTNNGILKAEASLRFAQVLVHFGVETFQQIHQVQGQAKFENAIKAIPGQSSGICLRYFYMLAGEENEIKPDRMVLRFIERHLGRSLHPNDAADLIREVCTELNARGHQISLRSLDHAIWQSETRK